MVPKWGPHASTLAQLTLQWRRTFFKYSLNAHRIGVALSNCYLCLIALCSSPAQALSVHVLGSNAGDFDCDEAVDEHVEYPILDGNVIVQGECAADSGEFVKS